MKSVWSVALCLLLASPALAETSVSVEEWLYLQRIGLISSVNEDLWTAFEESGAANPELARYAKEVTHVNVVSLRKWGAPAAPLVEFHSSLVAVLTEMERLYAAVAKRNFGDADEMGARIQREMLEMESSWEAIEDRYATPPASH